MIPDRAFHPHSFYMLERLLVACWVIFHDFLVVCRFFKISFFKILFSGAPSECHTVWVGYQQTTKVATSKVRAENYWSNITNYFGYLNDSKQCCSYHWRSSHSAVTHVRNKILTFKGGHLMWYE